MFIPVKSLLGNWVRLYCQIAVSNQSYDLLKTDALGLISLAELMLIDLPRKLFATI